MMEETDKLVLDFSALGVTAGAWLQVLPSITALASLIWVCIRIYETETVQKLVSKNRN
tara:strand:- start:228 stop:401 length:174 start_codon:yes stop_codon:yes gene_type:complete